MDNFSYTDNVRAAFASCLPCLTPSASSNQSSSVANASHSISSPSTTRPPASSSDLEYLLRDPDSSDALSLHSNPSSATHRRARRRKRSKFSLTLFGYTLFGRPPIYLSDDDEVDDGRARTRASITASSSTLDSDAAPLDASTIERLTSPDHYAALVAQREREREQRLLEAEDEMRRKAERRARREERKVRARAEALRSLSGTVSSLQDDDTFEGFQGSGSGYGSGSGVAPELYNGYHQGVEVVSPRLQPERLGKDDDADDADLDGELYARKKNPSATLSASGSDSRSRTSASFSAGDMSHIRTHQHVAHQSIPYPHTEMHLPAHIKNKRTKKSSHRASKPTSAVSSVTSQSTSTVPYTPVESVVESPAVAAFPIPQERYMRDEGQADFPSAGLPGARRPKLDPRAFLAHQA